MVMPISSNPAKLKAFMERLKEYQSLLSKRKDGGLTIGSGPTSVNVGGRGDQRQDIENLREQLVRESGYFKPVVVDLTNKQFGRMLGTSFDIWSTALQKDAWPPSKGWALQAVIDSCNEAIGMLEAGVVPRESDISTAATPKAFIAHGGKTKALDRLCEFLRALGIEPIVVELQPSGGRTVDGQVEKHVQDSDCGIVFATKGGIKDSKSGREHPRLNVIDEFARLRSKFPDKVILLLEQGVDLPSNVSEVIHERFTKGNLEKAFLRVAMELRAFGMIRAEQPGR